MGWTYAYGVPSDVVSYLSIHLATATDDWNPQEFEIEALPDGTTALFCNIDTPVLRYVRRVTDTSKFQPAFINALSWLLSSKIAGPLLRGEAGQTAAKNALAVHVALLGMAKSSDASQRRVLNKRLPDHLAARGASPFMPTYR
jgi:hypothetical protein